MSSSRESSDFLLTILIPTYNRSANILELLNEFSKHANLLNSFAVNILISENVEPRNSKIKDFLDKFEHNLRIKLVNPQAHLNSAEENLFFAWKFVTGEYVWILGDDDPVNFEVLADLLKRCKNKVATIFKYNAVLLDDTGKLSGSFVTRCSIAEAKMPMLKFLQVVGMWHTGAGFSTWIFRSDLIDSSKGSDWVSSFRSPVYAHVTFFIRACFADEVLFVNLPLVNYRINEYVYQKDGVVDHWDNYTSKVKMPRYYPWTFGFMEQMKRLENEIGLKRNYWGSVVGDHFGTPRFLEFNSMVSLAIDQLALEIRKSGHSLTYQEWNELLDYFESIRPNLDRFWQYWRFQVETNYKSGNKDNTNLRRVYFIWKILNRFDHFRSLQSTSRSNIYDFDTFSIYAHDDSEIRERLYINNQVVKGGDIGYSNSDKNLINYSEDRIKKIAVNSIVWALNNSPAFCISLLALLVRVARKSNRLILGFFECYKFSSHLSKS